MEIFSYLSHKKHYNHYSIAFGVPGLLIQLSFHGVLGVIGAAIFIIGLSYYVRTKGRHPALCLIWTPSILASIANPEGLIFVFGGIYSISALLYFSLMKHVTPEAINE